MRTRLTNQLREQLWRYYPQILRLTDDLGESWILVLWQHANGTWVAAPFSLRGRSRSSRSMSDILPTVSEDYKWHRGPPASSAMINCSARSGA